MTAAAPPDQFRSGRVLERVRLSHRPRAGPRELSVADARWLEFARALALRPRLLLLDEVMAGLRGSEIEPSLALIHALRGEGMTIVAVEHVMKAILSISDEILVLHHGRVLTLGRPHDVLSDERGDRGLPWTPVRAPGGGVRPSC